MRAGRSAGLLATTAGAVIVVVGCVLPWLRTGRRRRSSFELFGLVDRLGFSPSGPIGWAIRLWPTVPLLAAVAVALAWTARRWALLLVALATVTYTVTVASATIGVQERSFLHVDHGPVVTMIGAALLLAGAVVQAVTV